MNYIATIFLPWFEKEEDREDPVICRSSKFYVKAYVAFFGGVRHSAQAQ